MKDAVASMMPGRHAAGLMFLLLFPGYFFYHSLVGLEAVPSFLGGYFGPLSSLGLLVLAWPVTRVLSRDGVHLIEILFGCIALVWIVSTLAGYVLGSTGHESELLAWSLAGLLYNVACYAVARTTVLGGPLFARAVLACFAGMVAIVFYNAEGGLFYLKLLIDDPDLATYQGFGRSLFVTAVMGFFLLRTVAARAVLVVLATAALFLNGARTEFVLFPVVILGYVALASAARRPVATTLGLAFAAVAVLAAAQAWLELLPETRMLQLLDVSSASSVQERALLTDAALETIALHPVLGNYGSYALDGGIGTYAHNLLSAWVNLGIAGFILYAATVLLMCWRALAAVARGERSVEWQLSFVLAFAALTAMALAKDYSYLVFSLAVGLGARAGRDAKQVLELHASRLDGAPSQ